MAGNPPKPPVLTFYRQAGNQDSKIEFSPQDLNKHVLFPAVAHQNGNLYQIQTGNGLLIARKIKADGNLDDGYIIYRFDTENKRWMPPEEKKTENDLKQFLTAAYQRSSRTFNNDVFKRDWQDHWIMPKDIKNKACEIAGIDSNLIPDNLFFVSDFNGIPLPLASPENALDRNTISLLKQLQQRNGASKKLAGELLNQNLVSAPADKDGIATQIRDAGAEKNKLIFDKLFSEHEALKEYFSDLLGKEENKDFAVILDKNGKIPRAAQLAATAMTRAPFDEAKVKAFLQLTTWKNLKDDDFTDFAEKVKNALANDHQTKQDFYIAKAMELAQNATPKEIEITEIPNKIEKANQLSTEVRSLIDKFSQTYIAKSKVTTTQDESFGKEWMQLEAKKREIESLITILAQEQKWLDDNGATQDLKPSMSTLLQCQDELTQTLALAPKQSELHRSFSIVSKDSKPEEAKLSQTGSIDELVKSSGDQKFDPKTTADTTINYRKHPIKEDEVNGELLIDNTNPKKMRKAMEQSIQRFTDNIGTHKHFVITHDDPKLIAHACDLLLAAGIKTANIHVPDNLKQEILPDLLSPESIAKFSAENMKEWSSSSRKKISQNPDLLKSLSEEQKQAISTSFTDKLLSCFSRGPGR